MERLDGADGRFELAGLTGKRLMLQASKPGHVTEVRLGISATKNDVKIKLVRGALELPRTKVEVPDGGPGSVDDAWFQRQLINPPDTADVMDSATAVAPS